MIKLYHKDENNKRILVSERETKKEIYSEMDSYIINELNFKSYYKRGWFAPNSNNTIEVIDYGSHTEFFEIVYETQ